MDLSSDFILCLSYSLKSLEIFHPEMVKWNSVDKNWAEGKFGEKN